MTNFKAKLYFNNPQAKLPCPDQAVGIYCPEEEEFAIQYRNNIEYVMLDNKPAVQNKFKYPVIAILLESPHTSEFADDEEHTPLGPASGRTGLNFTRYFAGLLENSKVYDQIEFTQKYEVVFINADQYQCSCGLNPLNPTFRNKNFLLNFANNRTDMLARIEAIKPFILINLVTSSLKKSVDETIKSSPLAKSCLYTIGTHPSAWGRGRKTTYIL